MGQETAISWCDHTFNTWWGCTHAAADDPAATSHADFGPVPTSPECDNCYAESFDNRLGGGHWGPMAARRFFGDAYWRKPLAWNAAAEKAGRRARVFCSSMADVFEIHPDPVINAQMESARCRLWNLIKETPNLDWLLLTKRAGNIASMLPWMVAPKHGATLGIDQAELDELARPWLNVWLGVTCGVRSSLWRVAKLREIPAAVRFVSAEPLLEHITAEDWNAVLKPEIATIGATPISVIEWLIVGDESGHVRRPAHPGWVRIARDAAVRNGVAFHFKQWAGGKVAGIEGARKGSKGKIHLPVLDGKQWAEVPR